MSDRAPGDARQQEGPAAGWDSRPYLPKNWGSRPYLLKRLNWPCLLGTTGVAALALACALAPAGMAVVVVMVCAGPHNWCEARYFLSRMPGRWGPLRTYFLTAIAGVGALTLAFVALAVWPVSPGPSQEGTTLVRLALWHTALIGWIAVLVALRQRQPPARDWQWLVPPGLLLLAAAWAAPIWTSVALVYLHPLLALAFLDRELAVRRMAWHPSYRTTLALIPITVVLIWWSGPPVEAATMAARPEALQAGAFLLPDGVAGSVLATHVFLESLHYLAWIVAIPLATRPHRHGVGAPPVAAPWDLQRVPLAARSTGWRRLLAGLLLAGLVGVVILWIAFTIDYETTRQVYFTVAIAHVLAEVPFLIRLL